MCGCMDVWMYGCMKHMTYEMIQMREINRNSIFNKN
jgi:hypothetical protein